MQPLKISSSLKSVTSITSINDAIFENIFEPNDITHDNHISLFEMKTLGVDLIDITNSTDFDVSNQKNQE